MDHVMDMGMVAILDHIIMITIEITETNKVTMVLTKNTVRNQQKTQVAHGLKNQVHSKIM